MVLLTVTGTEGSDLPMEKGVPGEGGGGIFPSVLLQQSLKLPSVGFSATSVSEQRQKVPLQQVGGMYGTMPLQKYPCHRNSTGVLVKSSPL